MNYDNDSLPSNVTLRDWEDTDTLRDNIYDGIIEEFRSSFPKSYGGLKVEVDDLEYIDSPTVPIKKQKEAILKNKYVHRRLRGNFKLTDEKTGELLEEKKATIMRVPVLTQRGTFIHNGSEYSLINQSRLNSGIYARTKNNGDLESHINPEVGSGKAFRVRLEPSTGQFKLDVGQSSLHLYSLLHDMGIDDKQLEDAWGENVLKQNRDKYDARVFSKAYKKLGGFEATEDKHHDERINVINNVFKNTKVKKETLLRTLPNLFQ